MFKFSFTDFFSISNAGRLFGLFSLITILSCGDALLASAAVDSQKLKDAGGLMQKQEYARAIDIYSKLLIDDTNNVHIMFNLGTALNYLNEETRAVDVLKRCGAVIDEKRQQKNITTEEIELAGHVFNNIAKIYINQKKYDDAIASCMAGIEYSNNLSWLYYNLGDAYKAKGLYDLSPKNYQKAYEIDPADISAGLGVVDAYCMLNNFEGALALIRELVKKSPENLELKFNMGSVMYKMQKKEEAIVVWKEIAEKYPNSSFGQIASKWLSDLGVSVDSQKVYKSGSVECEAVGMAFMKPENYIMSKKEEGTNNAVYLMSRFIYDDTLKNTTEISLSVNCTAGAQAGESYKDFAKTMQANQKSNGENFLITFEKELNVKNGIIWEYEANFQGVKIKGVTFASVQNGREIVIWLNSTPATYPLARMDFDTVLESLFIK